MLRRIVDLAASMNENSPKNTAKGSPVRDMDSPGPLAGQRLANARRENDVSIAEIAKELHLDEPKVQALEENLFDVLGAPVFAKGHLRKYAELIGVPVDDILADYYKLNRSAGAPPVVGPKRPKLPTDISLGPWIGGTVVALLLVGAAYWWLNREPAPVVTVAPGVLEPFVLDRAVEESVSTEASATEDVPVEEADSADTDTAIAVVPQAADPSQLADRGPTPPAGEDQIQIVITYSGDCWTEVTDANGERLFFGLGQAGQTVTRNGTPPLQALFGDASNVSVTVDGVDFPISGSTRRGNTAKATIGDR